jgi:hypothetical protein
MLKRLKFILICLAIVVTLCIAKAGYEEYRATQNYQRAMDMMRQPEHPDLVIEHGGTIRSKGYTIRP